MLSISLGPIALPVPPLLLLVAIAGSAWLASRLASREQSGQALDTVVLASLLGLLAARLTHVALHADLYMVTPWRVFDIRDGGWHAPAGAAAGGAWLLWCGWRQPGLRRALAWSGSAGVLAWSTSKLLLQLANPAYMPVVAVQALESGQALTLPEAARGRPVVVNLWATWCAPCREEMPVLAAAQQKEASVGFLFVNQGEPAARVRGYLAREGLPLREVLLDPASALGPAVGSSGLPTTLFYDSEGRLQASHLGVLNAAALEARLRALRSPP